jgi:GalNAc-alpha-(1->4)-GalNAc-alpha-(1->3)-diNAcBac-PP-undecaprenol alpha-1,4-N-acetyl-D-galactosaminyltransferase
MKFLKSLVVNYELDDKIDFIGFSKNIISHLRKAKIFALSSREEGLPMVLIEAMSQGVASIAFDCITGPSDIITNNYDGLLVENQNINEFTEKLKNLMEDSKSRNTLGSNAIRSVKRYDIKKIINKWEEIFKEVCG